MAERSSALRRSRRPRSFEAAPIPAYRIDRSFEWNYMNGPAFVGPWPSVPATPFKSFFGLPVRSRFGVGAGILLNSRWVETYAKLGFDILTYKTVRDVARPCLPPPNWRFADPDALARLADPAAPQRAAPPPPGDAWRAGFVGSFGTPSVAPEMWLPDIAVARQCLEAGQVLIVSVLATVTQGSTEASVIDEYRRLAEASAGAGAQIVEANLSCPNVRREEGEVYRDPLMVARIAEALRAGAGERPVLLKFGPELQGELLDRVLQAAAPHVDGVVLANALPRPVRDELGLPFFGAGREQAGVCGAPVKPFALDLVRRAAAIVRRDRLGLKIVALGGVASAEDAREFLDAGAYAVTCVTAAAWNPFLAGRIKDADPSI